MRPGLSQAEFKRLFAQCQCGLVMTRRAFDRHICAIAAASYTQGPRVFIDLTAGSEEDKSDVENRVIDLTTDSE